MMKQIKTHFVGDEIVKRPSLVEHLVHVSPRGQLFMVVEGADLYLVEPVVLSPVWPRLELLKELVFHHLLKFVNTVCSGEEWYLVNQTGIYFFDF